MWLFNIAGRFWISWKERETRKERKTCKYNSYLLSTVTIDIIANNVLSTTQNLTICTEAYSLHDCVRHEHIKMHKCNKTASQYTKREVLVEITRFIRKLIIFRETEE